MGRTMSNGRIGLTACPAGVPYTAPQGVTVHDAFPSVPTKKKKKQKRKGKRRESALLDARATPPHDAPPALGDQLSDAPQESESRSQPTRLPTHGLTPSSSTPMVMAFPTASFDVPESGTGLRFPGPQLLPAARGDLRPGPESAPPPSPRSPPHRCCQSPHHLIQEGPVGLGRLPKGTQRRNEPCRARRW